MKAPGLKVCSFANSYSFGTCRLPIRTWNWLYVAPGKELPYTLVFSYDVQCWALRMRRPPCLFSLQFLIDLSQYPSAKWTLLCVNASRNVQATPLLFCPHLPSRRPQWELQEQQWPIGAPSYAEGACTSHKVFFSLSLNKTTNSLWKKSDQDEPQHQPYTLSTNTSPWRRKSSYDFRMLDNYTKIFLENLEWK